METIWIETGPHGRGLEVPLVVAWDAGGGPAELIGDVEPGHCDHRGQVWSDCLDLRCTRCGARLFMPGRCLAGRSEAVLEAMYAAWVRAGWPSYAGGQWPAGAAWTVIAHPLFAHVGGLAVRADRLVDFEGAADERQG